MADENKLTSSKHPAVAYKPIVIPLGVLHLAATEKGLALLCFGRSLRIHLSVLKAHARAIECRPRYFHPAQRKLIKQAEASLRRYWSGQLSALNRVPLNPLGTVFQRRVWRVLRKIHPGRTTSYREVARRIGDRRASRAVGMACAKNPICLAVPCHRVIREDGKLGGYAGGLRMKQKLLQHEERIIGNVTAERFSKR